LQIEQIGRRLAAAKLTHSHFFPTGMDDRNSRRVRHNVPKWSEGTHRERIDDVKPIGRGDLDQAQARVKRILANEFGVKAELRTPRQMRTTLFQATIVVNELLCYRRHALPQLPEPDPPEFGRLSPYNTA